jgi:hypothetical protein
VLEFWSEQSAPRETFAHFYARWFGGEQPRPQRLIPFETKPSRERIEREINDFRAGGRDQSAGGIKILAA